MDKIIKCTNNFYDTRNLRASNADAAIFLPISNRSKARKTSAITSSVNI